MLLKRISAAKTFLLLPGLILMAAQPALCQQAPPSGCAAMLESWKSLAVETLADWRWREAGDFRGEAPDLDDSSWPLVPKGHSWESTTVWLRRWYVVPHEKGGYSFRGARLLLHVPSSWAAKEYASVFVNGLLRSQGHEIEPLVLTENAQPGERFLIAIRLQQDAGKFWPPAVRVELTGVSGRPSPQTLLEECVTAEVLNDLPAAGKPERDQRLAAVRSAIRWDLLAQGQQKAFDDSLLAARLQLEPLRDWLMGYNIVAAGNSHIDMAWLWPWTETVEVTRNTFSSVLKLMQEFPEFKFTHASVQTYAWMEEKYPELFAQVQRRVREGRWEIVGGMWVEPDLNLPDGEALTRQLLIGKRWIRDRFGVDVRIGWNPDSFGYNAQLPQIYKRSGIDYFVTQKIGWNDTTRFPHKLFWWEAPDGSRLLTFFPHDYVNLLEPTRMARDMAATARIAGLPVMLHLYGIGDHGGGPTRAMLNQGRSWLRYDAIFPRLTLSTVLDFFRQVESRLPATNVPVWKDELYLEYHRGTYTTQARTKKNNRRNEALVLNTEKFSTLASLFGSAYPRRDLDEVWRKLLFNQFHDILPGSSIAPVYVDADRDHAEIARQAGARLREALAELAARVNTQGDGVPVVVFNPLAWQRSELVEADVSFAALPADVEVRAGQKPVLAQVVSRSTDPPRLRIRFLAEDVPSLGYKTFHVVPARKPRRPPSPVSAAGLSMENEFLRVRLDASSGCIISLYDKRQNREVLAPGSCGNLLTAFRDKPKDWDAWNIDANFEDQKWDLTAAEEVRLIESGPLRAVFRVVRSFQKSRFVQEIVLAAGIPRVDIHTQADWHEDHILIKAAFSVAARSDFATFEIPYGSIQRPTTRRTPEEKAKFEVPALRWADLSDASGGLSLLNDSKYGYDAKDNVLRISLLRSPKWPDPNADMGRHEFVYSLYPHPGSWKDAGTVHRGYELNYPLLPVPAESHPGALPAAHSFVSLEPENLVLTALKRAEDGDAWILRCYEFAGKPTQARVRLPQTVGRAHEADLQEKVEKELPVKGSEVEFAARPFEIKTLRLELPQEPRR